jgi:hypothetical protein
MKAPSADMSSQNAYLLVRALALQVRLLTLDQMRRGWFPASKLVSDEATDCADHLVTAGLLERRVVEAHPVIDLKKPLFAWAPGSRHPSASDFQAIADASRMRWNSPHLAVEVFTAWRANERSINRPFTRPQKYWGFF